MVGIGDDHKIFCNISETLVCDASILIITNESVDHFVVTFLWERVKKYFVVDFGPDKKNFSFKKCSFLGE